MTTTLTYVLATENGDYNPTVPWKHLHTALNVYGRYKDVNFVRINDWNRANLRVVNAKSLNSWAAYYRSSRTMRIHPTVDYGKNPTTLTKVVQHEIGHLRRDGHHSSERGLMHPTGGRVFNWGTIDDPWWSQYAWRSSLRPWNEPDYFKTVFAASRMVELFGDSDPTLTTEDAQIKFGCPSWWQDRSSKKQEIHSIAEISADEERMHKELQHIMTLPERFGE